MTESSVEIITYFKEIFNILRVQGFVLSVSGMSMGRSRFSLVQELSIDTLKLLVDEDKLYEGEKDEILNPGEYPATNRDKVERKESKGEA